MTPRAGSDPGLDGGLQEHGPTALMRKGWLGGQGSSPSDGGKAEPAMDADGHVLNDPGCRVTGQLSTSRGERRGGSRQYTDQGKVVAVLGGPHDLPDVCEQQCKVTSASLPSHLSAVTLSSAQGKARKSPVLVRLGQSPASGHPPIGSP